MMITCPNCEVVLEIEEVAPTTPKTEEESYADMIANICIKAWQTVLEEEKLT